MRTYPAHAASDASFRCCGVSHICYTDFYPRYCLHCGVPLDLEPELRIAPQQDLLNGLTITCACGAICRYLPEHRFPYQPPLELSATA